MARQVSREDDRIRQIERESFVEAHKVEEMTAVRISETRRSEPTVSTQGLGRDSSKDACIDLYRSMVASPCENAPGCIV